MESNRLAAIDVLKIDVEGFFMEVLKGIAANDFAKIANMVKGLPTMPTFPATPWQATDRPATS